MSTTWHDNIEPWLRVTESTARVQQPPADGALRDAEAKHRGAVGGILHCMVHQFERDGPWQGNSDEGETTLVEVRMRHSILVLRRGVEGRIVFASLLAAR